MNFEEMKIEIKHLIDSSSNMDLLLDDIYALLDNYKTRKFMGDPNQ